MRKMKDSGIEWIGEIPEDWKLSRIKFLSRVLRGASPRPIDNPVYFDPKGKFSWVRISDVTTSNHYLYNAGEKLSELGASKSVKIEPNNLFISICATVGKPCISKINCCIHDGFVYFPNLEKTFTEYLYWIFFSGTCYQGLGNWGTQLNLNTNIIGNIHIAYPSENKRKIITNYINICCDRIDTLIKKEQQVIEKLKAYRQSVISEAVTRGLDPDAPMKDSGIPWIGKIPEDWKIDKIKYISKFNPGYSRHFDRHESVGYLPMECLKHGYMTPLKTEYEKITSALTCFEDGDIVLAKVTPCFENGNIAIAHNLENHTGFGSSELFVFRCSGYETRFLFYIFQNSNFMNECISTMTGTGGLKRVSSDFIRNCRIPVPDLQSQQQIADYLDEKCAKIDRIIQEKEQIIVKLTEYKKSIIYEYVTGKKEVPAS